MKNKLLISIMAFMLVIVASVSALTVSVSPTSVSMTEDIAKADAVTLTVTDTVTEPVNVTCTGLHLSFVVGSGTNTSGTWEYKPDVTPEANFNGDTSFKCTVDTVDSDTVNVSVAPENDAPTITSTAKTEAVEDNQYSYDVEATDVDSTTLTFSLTTKPDGMTINSATGLISWTPDNDQLGNREVVVQVTDGSLNATQSFTITTRPKKVCKYGEIGDLDLTVDDPDSDDEFKAGDKIDINANIENDGNDDLRATLTAMLYDLDEGKLMKSVKSDERKIRDGEEENFDLELEVPTTEFDEDNKFMLYFVAHEDEDEHCTYKAVPVDLVREDDDVLVKELTLTPESAVPGSKVTATITVENIGTDDQKNVYVKLRNSYLNLVHETESFELGDYKSDDKDKTLTVTFEVPKDAQLQDYWLDAVVYFDGGSKSDSRATKLSVTGKAKEESAAQSPALDMTPETGLSVKAGKQLAVPVVLKNKGSSKAAFTLEVSNVDSWAKVITIEQPEQLNAGESGHAYVYLEAKSDAAIGVHEFSLNVRDSAGLVATKKVGVSLEGQAQSAAPEAKTSGSRITGLFTAVTSSGEKAFWAVGAAVLVLVGLFFLRLLFKK